MILLLVTLLLGLFSYPAFPKESPKILYKSDSLIITKTKATYKGRILYDAVKGQKQLVESEGEADASHMEHSYMPRSVNS